MPALAPRRPKRRTEATVLAETRLALCSMPGVTVWRNTTGFAETDGRKFRYGLCPGSSDLVGCLRVTPPGSSVPLAVALFVETKHPTSGRLAADQATFGEVVRRLGAVHIVASSADDAVLQLHLHRKRIENGGTFT